MIANSSCLFIHIPLTAEGGVQREADAAHPNICFLRRKKQIFKSLIVQIVLLLGDFLQLRWGSVLVFFHLEDSTFVFQSGVSEIE